MEIRRVRNLVRGLTVAGGVLLTVGLGLACLRYSFSEPIVRLSYDVPFLWRTPIETHEIVLVYLDEYSARILNQRFDSIDKVGRLKMPVLFIHGSADEVVPTWMGQVLYQAAPQPKRMLMVPGGHHMDSAEIGGQQYLDAVRDFIQSISKQVRNAS